MAEKPERDPPSGGKIARWRNYFFSPDVLVEICNELGVPHRINGYRYWRKTS